MRIRTNHVRMNERRAVSLAAILGGTLKCGVGSHWISAVDLFKMEIRETGHKAGDAASGRLHFDRNRDSVAVVFDAEDYWQAAQRSGVHRLPKLSFTRSAIAERNVGDF